MTGVYRIFGSEMSPYSLKVRSYFRYKNIPHEWLLRGANSEEYQKYARLPIVPTLAAPDGEGLQDSTPIIEGREAQVPTPAIHPDDPTLKFLSQLIEEFGDEWGNKWMFHYRWQRRSVVPFKSIPAIVSYRKGAWQAERERPACVVQSAEYGSTRTSHCARPRLQSHGPNSWTRVAKRSTQC